MSLKSSIVEDKQYIQSIQNPTLSQMVDTEEGDTSIRVKISTREKMRQFGKFGESYDDIIKRLIEFYQDKNKDNKKWILENIIKNFWFEQVEKPGNKYPKFGKAGRKKYLFTCKRCRSQSEPMLFHQDIKYRLYSHLVNNCHPSSDNTSSTEEVEQSQQQGPVV